MADALLMFAIPRQDLGPVVASLAADESASRIVHQIDRMLSRVYQ